MTNEEDILNKFDEYFKNTSKEELLKDAEYVNSFGNEGITVEDYMKNLNKITVNLKK